MKTSTWTAYSLIGAISAAIIAALCCFGPLVLLGVGLGGAYVSTLTHFEFLRPIGIAVAVIFLGFAFWKLYIIPKGCTIDKPCIKPHWLRIQRVIFWIITVLLLVIITFPWYAHLFY